MVGKGEIAGYQHFLLFPQCFQKASFSGSLKVVIVLETVNSLPNGKILHWSKHADDKFKVAKIMIFVLDRVENIVGKGENAGYQHFLLFPQCFQKASFLGVVKSRDCVVKS